MAWKNVQYENGKYRTSEGGGGGGSSTFAGLDDVSFSDLQNGQVPKYNSTTKKWENANESGSEWHEYSTEERIVGTYLGKPLYQKTYTNLSISATPNSYVHSNIVISTIDKVVAVISAIDNNNQSVITKFGLYSDKELALMVTPDSVTIIEFTIQYTKTTD